MINPLYIWYFMAVLGYSFFMYALIYYGYNSILDAKNARIDDPNQQKRG